MSNSAYTLRCRGKLLPIDHPLVMGIINATPDSFYAGSRQQQEDAVVEQAGLMLEAGAAILDIGGQSTRPGADAVGAAAEAARVVPAIEAIVRRFPEAVVSVDTFWSAVARQAVDAGASIVNDISGGMFDKDMLDTVGGLQVPYVCMHTKGTMDTMHQMATYDDVVLEVLDYFMERLHACRKAGIHDVIIDPGFGFAKTAAHNFQLLQQLDAFKILERPLLLGVSRKSTIYKTLGVTAAEALNGTTVLNTIGLLKGASVLRVHDVKEAVEAVRLVQALQEAQG